MWIPEITFFNGPEKLPDDIAAELQKEIRPLIVPEAASALLPFVYGLTMIDLLERPDARFGSEPEKARENRCASQPPD